MLVTIYDLPLEIIEHIAGEDLYLQAMFCKLNLYNTNTFLINFKKYSLEFYKNSFIIGKYGSYKNNYRNTYDNDIMNMNICYEYFGESFFWFANNSHGNYEEIMEQYDTYYNNLNKVDIKSHKCDENSYCDFCGDHKLIQIFYILFCIIDKSKLFTLQTLLQFNSNVDLHLINIDIDSIIIISRYLIYRNIDFNIKYCDDYKYNISDIAIKFDISLRINNTNYINYFNKLTHNEKKNILSQYSHSNRIYDIVFKNINMLKTLPKLSKFVKYKGKINLDNIIYYYIKNDDYNYNWFKDINYLLNDNYFYNYNFSRSRDLTEEKLLYLHKNISMFNFPSCIFYKILKNYIDLLLEYGAFPKIIYIINNNILNNYRIIKKYKLQNMYSKHLSIILKYTPENIYNNDIAYEIISNCKIINTLNFNKIVKIILSIDNISIYRKQEFKNKVKNLKKQHRELLHECKIFD